MFWSTRKTDLSFQYENVSIHPSAEVGSDVEIGPFTVIGPNCRIGDGCHVHNNVTLVANTVLGDRTEVFPGAVIGAVPQDKKYSGEDCWVIIGDDNTIRECVTIHGGTDLGGKITRIGNRNLLMAGCHVAHDCVIENDTIIANNVLLGGHCQVESYANLGGQAAVHHFVTVGRHAFVAGTARVNTDVPPFMLWQGDTVRTINKVGLRRRGFTQKQIMALRGAFKRLYREGLPRNVAIEQIREDSSGVGEIDQLLRSLERTQRGRQG
ncbi:MAG: acyl-ACP--UDP-N-acetylglucosamine O-acyltransferase, partial [Planctomycetota bacterium]